MGFSSERPKLTTRGWACLNMFECAVHHNLATNNIDNSPLILQLKGSVNKSN